MRCLTLAQKLKSVGWTPVFLMAESLPSFRDRLDELELERFDLGGKAGSSRELAETRKMLVQWDSPWLILDGYQFEEDYLNEVKNSGAPVLFVDDHCHLNRYPVDMILNQNLFADPSFYRNLTPPRTQFLLGADYVLLREAFLSVPGNDREAGPSLKSVFVNFGGTDPLNLTTRVIDLLLDEFGDSLEITGVLGGDKSQSDERQESLGRDNVTVFRNVKNMAHVMKDHDLAICAGGSTVWELTYLGIPTLVLPLADNQQPVAQTVDQKDIGLNLGKYTESESPCKILSTIARLKTDSDRLTQMSSNARNLIDGQGVNRTVEAINSYTKESQ